MATNLNHIEHIVTNCDEFGTLRMSFGPFSDISGRFLMIGGDGRRRVNVLGQIAFIIESCIRVLGQFETFVRRFG